MNLNLASSFAPFLLLVAFGILLFIMPSRKKYETRALFGIYFICKAILNATFVCSITCSVIELEYIRGFIDNITTITLYFGFFSLVFPLEKLLRAYFPIIILIVAISCVYTITLISYSPEQQQELMKVIWEQDRADIRFPAIFHIKNTMGLTALAVIMYFQVTIFRFGFGFKKFAANNYSYTERLNMKFFIYLELFLLSSILIDSFIIYIHTETARIIYIFYSAIFAFSVYYLIANDKVLKGKLFQEQFLSFIGQSESSNILFLRIVNKRHEVSPNYTTDAKYDLRQKLITYFKEEKPYISKKLNSHDVAKALNTNRTYVSQIINRDFNTTFYHFVNVFRIEEAKIRISKMPNYSLKSIADECGFSSYTTFSKYYNMYKYEKAQVYGVDVDFILA